MSKRISIQGLLAYCDFADLTRESWNRIIRTCADELARLYVIEDQLKATESVELRLTDEQAATLKKIITESPNSFIADLVPGEPAPALTAPKILSAAAKHMEDRAATYDSPQGERSMGKTVTAFNAITERDLTESEGFLLLQILKDVRDRQNPAKPHRDSLEDGVAYAALKSEARLRGD